MDLESIENNFDILKHLNLKFYFCCSRLFNTFNEFANILENALLPPVLKIARKLKIKIKEYDQKSSQNYISDLNALVN